MKGDEYDKFMALRKKNKAIKEDIKKGQNQMKSLGIRVPHGQRTTLISQQALAIDLLLDFHNNWSPDYIAEKCNISTRMLHKWRNDPIFLKELDKEITKRRTRMRLEAYRLLFKKIRFGNPKFLKMYLELTGDLKKHMVVEDETQDTNMEESDVDKELRKLRTELGMNADGPLH